MQRCQTRVTVSAEALVETCIRIVHTKNRRCAAALNMVSASKKKKRKKKHAKEFACA